MPDRIANTADSTPQPRPSGSARRGTGFTLLELLLAITALIIITLGLTLVFQQVQSAWSSCNRQANVENTLRSILLALERDLNNAVDATEFGLSDRDYNDFDAPVLQFVTLEGTNRVPQVVTYTYTPGNGELKRETQQLQAGNPWTLTGTAVGSVLNSYQKMTSFSTDPKYPTPSLVSSNLPLYVIIEAHAQKGGSFGVVSGWCAGRNRSGHPEDRIVVNP